MATAYAYSDPADPNRPCPTCKGQGYIPADSENACPRCNGIEQEGFFTYVVHVPILAPDDATARAMADALFERLSPAYIHLTDADDWAEHVTRWCACGAPAVDRLRNGSGKRVCQACADRWPAYPIRDA